MALPHRELMELLDLIEKSDLEYVEVQYGDTHVVADRTGGSGAAGQQQAPADGLIPPASEAAHGDARDALTEVKAPAVGVFHRTGGPDATPLVQVGDRVPEGANLGRIKVVRDFDTVVSPVAGEVAEFLVEDESFVEYGQPLVRIRPDATS